MRRMTTTKSMHCTILIAMFAVQACYSYVPVDSQASAPVGQVVELQITDRGRVGLNERFGAGVREIAGRVVGDRGSDVVLTIDRVTTISGSANVWSGDTARVGREFIGGMTLRRFAVGRTSALVAVAAAAVYLMSSKALTGGGSADDGGVDPPPSTNTRIPPFRFRIPLP